MIDGDALFGLATGDTSPDLAGFNILFLGVIGEYVGRIYLEVKARPHYIIRKVTRGAAASARVAPNLDA